MATFVPKNWENSPAVTTPISEAALEDLETRVTDYADIKGAVSALEYASGDGITDDTTALDDLATDVGTGAIYLPPGTYLHTGAWQPGGRVFGPGTIKRSGASTAILLALNNADQIIDGITLDKNGADGNVVVFGGARSEIRNCTIKNSPGNGVQSDSVDGLVVVGNTFLDIDTNQILLENCDRFRINGNRCYNASSGNSVFVKSSGGNRATDGVINGNVLDLGAANPGIEVWGDRVAVTGNTVGGTSNLPISLSGATDCTVLGNVISNTLEVAGSSQCTISGNVIENSGTGIWATGSGEGNVYSGNTINAPSSKAIDCSHDRSVISDNIIIDSGDSAIYLNGAVEGNVISNNNIRFTSTSQTGIVLSGVDHLVSGNLIDATGVGTNNGYGISSASAANARYHITGNQVIGVKKGIYLDDTDHSFVDGNRTMDTTEHEVYITSTCVKCFIGTHFARRSAGNGVVVDGTNNAAAAIFEDGTITSDNIGTWPP